MIPRCWPAVIALTLSMRFCGPEPVHAGGITCSATCLSKLASAVSIAANGKTIVAAAKKIRHPKAKATKGTK